MEEAEARERTDFPPLFLQPPGLQRTLVFGERHEREKKTPSLASQGRKKKMKKTREEVGVLGRGTVRPKATRTLQKRPLENTRVLSYTKTKVEEFVKRKKKTKEKKKKRCWL